MNTLTAISPLDGRYYESLSELSEYFSEYAYIRMRVLVEVKYFIALCKIPLPQLKGIDTSCFSKLDDIYIDFNEQDTLRIKEIEKTTNHDVKAVEYFVKEKFEKLGLAQYKEFIHFGLTSQDINNTALPYLMRLFNQNMLETTVCEILDVLKKQARQWKNIPMLARTHGQAASPTLLGKEWFVFYERLHEQLHKIYRVPFCGKFGGATGNFNAHRVAYPKVKWVDFANKFLQEELGIERYQTTTQIEHYDNMAAYFDAVKRINTILLDLNRDVWMYISMDYFKQEVKVDEVGSSAMPHKVNPIDFENSEGNICIANALLEALSAKLPVSRLQRDLTDSTVTRNIGVALGHSILAYNSLLKGLHKLRVNKTALKADLDKNWAVVAEAIQTILRREQYPNPYEALKELTRGKADISKKTIRAFIDSLEIDPTVKKELKCITPHNYTGVKWNV